MSGIEEIENINICGINVQLKRDLHDIWIVSDSDKLLIQEITKINNISITKGINKCNILAKIIKSYIEKRNPNFNNPIFNKNARYLQEQAYFIKNFGNWAIGRNVYDEIEKEFKPKKIGYVVSDNKLGIQLETVFKYGDLVMEITIHPNYPNEEPIVNIISPNFSNLVEFMFNNKNNIREVWKNNRSIMNLINYIIKYFEENGVITNNHQDTIIALN